MSGETISPNMSLPIPGTGITGGPTWANDLNSSLTLIDAHNHSAGQGVQINPSGININSDLPFNANNLTTARSLRMSPQAAVLSLPADLGCLSVVGVDLYYNDLSGNKIQITQSGGIAGTPGSISNLTSPASAAYVAANTKFVWQSAANTSAIMDNGSIIMRNATASSKGMTINPPAAMAADFSITFPALPGSTKIMSMDATGSIGASYGVDNTTIQITANNLNVKDASITQAKKAVRTVSSSPPVGGMLVTGSCLSFSTTSSSFVNVSNLGGTLTTLGNPVQIKVVPDGSTATGLTQGKLGASRATGNVFASFQLLRDGSVIATWLLAADAASSTYGATWSPSSIDFVDRVGAGTYLYQVQAAASTGGTTVLVQYCVMTAWEI